jgi:hypothetical protein
MPGWLPRVLSRRLNRKQNGGRCWSHCPNQVNKRVSLVLFTSLFCADMVNSFLYCSLFSTVDDQMLHILVILIYLAFSSWVGWDPVGRTSRTMLSIWAGTQPNGNVNTMCSKIAPVILAKIWVTNGHKNIKVKVNPCHLFTFVASSLKWSNTDRLCWFSRWVYLGRLSWSIDRGKFHKHVVCFINFIYCDG